MIKFSESLLLASTKLKMRKIRLVVTVLISALLFAGLVFLASITDGAIRSLQDFGQEGYGRRFFVQASPITYQAGPGADQALVDQLQSTQRDLVAKKKAAAKALDVTYDENTDPSLPLSTAKTGPDTTQTFLNYQSKIAQDAINTKNATIPGTSFDDFKKMAQKAGAINVYRGTVGGKGFDVASQQIKIIINGQESFTAKDQSAQPFTTTGIESINTVGWRAADEALLKPFTLPGQSLATGADGSVPIIAPFSAAEQILGLKPLAQTVPSKQKIERLVQVRKQIAGKTAELCYRNIESSSLVDQAAQQQKEIETNKNNKDFVSPSLVYQLPSAPCGPVTIKSDKRSDEEKKQAANLQAFKTQFGQYVEPTQGLMTIRIVGVSPDTNFGPSLSASAILTSLFSSTIGGGWVSPAASVSSSSLAAAAQGITVETASRGQSVYYAEFGSLSAMERVMKDQTCKEITGVQGPSGVSYNANQKGEDSVGNCISAGKVLAVTPYGNSAGAIEQFRSIIWKVARYVILAIMIVAALIMMGNVGKIIADSRRETAVFRALGAKRLDIAQIYITYTVLISLLIGLCAFVFGWLAARAIDSRYSPDLSVTAVLTYNAQDVHKHFSLFGLNGLYLGGILGLIIIAGLISAALPLVANMRRNPIKDMRDDA